MPSIWRSSSRRPGGLLPLGRLVVAVLLCVLPLAVQGQAGGRSEAPPVFLGTDLGENPMSKEVGGMVQSRRVKGTGSARPESGPTLRRLGRGPWRLGSGGARAGSGTSCCGCCAASHSTISVSREVGVEIYRLEEWKARALAGLELGLKDQVGEPVAAALDAAKRHIGELSMENELLRERASAAERRLPLAMRRSRR